MLIRKLFTAIFLMVIWYGCTNNNKPNINELNRIKGDSIATIAQQLLVKNLTKQINDSGFAYAVTFCNQYANELLTELESSTQTTIGRVSLKNRNEQNAANDIDKSVLTFLEKHYKNDGILRDTIVVNNNNVTYYKTIVIGMETCLSCHGESNKRDALAYENILKLYPNDLAIDYKLKDFKGAWKIKL